MRVNVNLFKPSGEWAYGGVVEVSGAAPFYDRAFKKARFLETKQYLQGAVALTSILL